MSGCPFWVTSGHCTAKGHVRFTPIATAKTHFRKTPRLLYPRKQTRGVHKCRGKQPASDERVLVSTGERDGSGSAFAPRIQRRSTGSDYRNRDCPPKYCLCGSSLRTSNTDSPNTHCPGLTKSPRNTEPRLLRVRDRSLWMQELPQPPKSCV